MPEERPSLARHRHDGHRRRRDPAGRTLTLPPGPGPHPAALLLHGSGPLDRDGNTPKLRMDLARPLATALAARGIATFRHDRRGTGATPGDWRTPASPTTAATPWPPYAPSPPGTTCAPTPSP
ncbi:hypothetical protein ACFQVA_23525 [Actinomadura keratinilytica]